MPTVQKIKEYVIEDAFVKACKARGLEQRKVCWIGRRAAPDRVIFVDGGVYVELKRPGGKPRASQDMEHARMKAGGMKVYVVSTLDELEDFFENQIDSLNRDTL